MLISAIAFVHHERKILMAHVGMLDHYFLDFFLSSLSLVTMEVAIALALAELISKLPLLSLVGS